MEPLALTIPVALAASLLLTVAVRSAARRWAIVDHPDGRRKLHPRPVPLWGGVAVYGAAVLGLVAYRLATGDRDANLSELSTAWMIAAGFVCFVGGVDDRFDLPSRLKLVLQIAAVLPIVMLGYYVDRIVAFGCPIELGWLGIPLTVLWLVGCINALNLIDGMDGLASIVGLSAAAMMGVIAASEGHAHVAVMATVLAAALLGFLPYNLPPASIFLGDSGSMVIGLTLGVLGIQGSLKTSATLAVTAPAVVMTLPMFDIAAALVRRKLTGQRFDAPDRLHIHHRLLDRGWSPWQVLCLIGTICLTTGAAATAATIFRRDALAWITAMTLVVLMVRLRLFGHDEFALAKEAAARAVQAGLRAFRRVWRVFGTQQASLPGKQDGVVAAAADDAAFRSPATAEPHAPSAELWERLLRKVRALNIREVEFLVVQDHQPRRIRWMDPAAPADQYCRWSLTVSLPGVGDEVCQLRAAGPEPIADGDDLAALESMLKAYGGRFAADAGRLLGPLLEIEQPAAAEPYPDHRRQAA